MFMNKSQTIGIIGFVIFIGFIIQVVVCLFVKSKTKAYRHVDKKKLQMIMGQNPIQFMDRSQKFGQSTAY